MTTEEKAKAYDEALERARKIHSEIVNNELLGFPGQIEDIFPQLRESEDEMVRKALIEALKASKTVGELKFTLSEPTREECIAYLEKQKINTEGDFGRGYDCGYQAGYAVAMNEMKPKVATATLDSEQKEPHYTKRNALFDKCVENCDPKVMKEVSDKVDEMLGKPSCWDSPVMTHEMIMDEQKENPKSADSIPSDCTSDAKCENRSPKHSDSDGTDIRDTPAYWRGWDDAMKQKEQKHPHGCFTCDEYKKGYETGRLNGFTAGYNKAMKEQKPAECELEDAFKNYTDAGITVSCGDMIASPAGKPLFKKGDWVVYDGVLGHGILQVKDIKAGRYTFVDNESTLLAADSDKHLRPLTPKDLIKPAEWDDKDEKVYDYLKGGFEYATNNPNLLNSLLSGASDATIQDYRNFIDKLKILRPQPKQEWSEVELEFRGEKVKMKRPFFRDDKGRGYSTTEQDDEVTWNALRAWAESHGYTPFDLYPREEWSEEDEEVRRQLICVLSGGIALTTKETRSKMLEWLKSLRPSWKPSEEQMKALRKAVVYFGDSWVSGTQRALESLYEQLKRLM